MTVTVTVTVTVIVIATAMVRKKQRHRVDSNETPMIHPMKYTLDFLSGKNGIFVDSNDKDNNQTPKKIRKTEKYSPLESIIISTMLTIQGKSTTM